MAIGRKLNNQVLGIHITGELFNLENGRFPTPVYAL